MAISLFILIQTQGRDKNVGTFLSVDLSLTLAHVMWRGLWLHCIKNFTSWKIQLLVWPHQSQAGEL